MTASAASYAAEGALAYGPVVSWLRVEALAGPLALLEPGRLGELARLLPEYRLHPVGPTVLGGPIFWRFEDAPQVLRFLRDFAPTAPDELGITMAMMLAPPAPFLPPAEVGRPVLAWCWPGPATSTRASRRPPRSRARLADRGTGAAGPVCGTAVGARRRRPHGRHYYWKSHRLAGLPDQAIELLVERVASITSPFSQISGWAMGGAVSRVDPEATAVGEREVGFDLSLAAAWPPPDPDPGRHLAWVREGWEALRPHSMSACT